MYRLLIAEDELIERMVLKKMLLKKLDNQCEIFEAQNGKEAVEIFRREAIQIAILDISMPGMSGMEAAEIMRKEDRDCCLIFLTAYDRFDYAKKAISVQAMEYLLKPYASREVINVVEEACRLVREREELREKLGGQTDVQAPRPQKDKPRQEAEETEPSDDSWNRLAVMTSLVEEYIRRYFMEEISMHDAAAAVGYSEPYFCRMFKQQYGQSFTSYLTEYRVGEAKKLLAQPNVNVKEAGARCGYPDSNYFTKVFRRITGVSPTEYRSGILKQLSE